MARTKMTPAPRPTRILRRFCGLHGTSKATRPSSATGILFKEPTRLYVVAVVDDRNHREAKLIQNASSELAIAAVKK